jgi:putative FmdB family regulatory protein
MPIYEYECQKCHEVTEALQKVSDPELRKCPHCGGKVHKMMSLNAFHLKGQGWYVTDYAGTKTEKSTSSDSTPTTDSASKPKGEGKSDKSGSSSKDD